ncbi:hypothetical protein D9M70_622140 [compost metagenome]
MWEQIEVLEHHAHLLAHRIDVPFESLAFQVLVDLYAIEPDLAAIQRLQVIDRSQQRGLAGAARADDRDNLPSGNGEVDALQDLQRAVVFAGALDFDHGF